MTTGVTAIIPTIPPRRRMLHRAIESVTAQSHPVDSIAVFTDNVRKGAWYARHMALMMANTEWVAFLDDDDTWEPIHVGHLLATAKDTDADYVYANFNLLNADGQRFDANRPFPRFDLPWDNERPRQTCITTLVKTELAQSVSFKAVEEEAEIEGNRFGEDFHFTLRCMQAGGKIVLHPEENTWNWYHHGENLSGLPTW